MDKQDTGASASPKPALSTKGFDPAREKSAFMAGWLTRNNRSDAPPEEAWLIYLDSMEKGDAHAQPSSQEVDRG